MKSKKAKKSSRPNARKTKKTARLRKGKKAHKVYAPSFAKHKKRKIAEKWRSYEKLLLELRDHLLDGINFLASDNLKRSGRDASGDLSAYSTHMADAGTDNFDREFALSLVSNEQEALFEIEEALKRLESGTYGTCEMCEKSIKKERLQAVPFARFCVNCQATVEKEQRRPQQALTAFRETLESTAAEAESEEEEEKE
jgi:RNA polymerase-binding transcription factor DksA